MKRAAVEATQELRLFPTGHRFLDECPGLFLPHFLFLSLSPTFASVYLCLLLSLSPPFYQSTHPLTYSPIHLPIQLSLHSSITTFIHPSSHPFPCLSVRPSIHPSIHSLTHSSIHPYTHLFCALIPDPSGRLTQASLGSEFCQR